MLKFIHPDYATAILAPLFLSACLAFTHADPQITALSQSISAQSERLYSYLSVAPSSECDYEHNKNYYVQLNDTASQLKRQLAVKHASKALALAADAIAQAITDAAHSHQLASAIIDDRNGPCLAPAAIAINADAIARAAAALKATQQNGVFSQ